MSKNNIDYKKIAKEIRKKILKIMYESKAAHIGSCLSCADILAELYFKNRSKKSLR